MFLFMDVGKRQGKGWNIPSPSEHGTVTLSDAGFRGIEDGSCSWRYGYARLN